MTSYYNYSHTLSLLVELIIVVYYTCYVGYYLTINCLIFTKAFNYLHDLQEDLLCEFPHSKIIGIYLQLLVAEHTSDTDVNSTASQSLSILTPVFSTV